MLTLFISVIPQIHGSSGNRKAAWDSHLSCLSSSNCSVDNKRQFCTNWSQDTWYKVIFRQQFADKIPAKKVKDKNVKHPRHSPSPSGALSEEDNSMAEQVSLGDEASINDALTPDGRVETRENKPNPHILNIEMQCLDSKLIVFLFKWNLMD